MIKNVLVTGGAGYIGSHTSKILAKKGYNVVVYDDLSTGYNDFVNWGPLVKGDILNYKKLVSAINEFKIDAVIHFAAKAYVSESISNPFFYYKNNVSGTLSLIEAMIKCKVRYLSFSSSCAVYGNPKQNILLDENHPTFPISPYGKSKLFMEKILSDISKTNDFNFISLRFFNAAGASEDSDIGESHSPETHLIPLAIKSCFDENYILKIYGDKFDTPDGFAVRDYIHVNDIALAHLKTLELLVKEKKSFFINLGTGNGISVKEIINKLIKMGLTPKYEILSRRDGDPDFLVSDNTKASSILGWKSNYNIDEILKSAIDWYEKTN